MTTVPFRDRADAGKQLAVALADHFSSTGTGRVVVLALPRGGVPVGFAVATALRAPLDLITVRKLGAPGQEELALGAIASGGVLVRNESVVRALRLSAAEIAGIAGREARELARRESVYRAGRPATALDGRTVIVVDDGLATGSTMRAALGALRQRRPAELIVAVPVGAPETCAELRGHADRIICLATPQPFYSVGHWYDDFTQTTDAEVRALLERAAGLPPLV